MNYGEAQTGKLEETLNHRVSYRNVPQTRPGGWPPTEPGPPPHGIYSALSLVKPLLPGAGPGLGRSIWNCPAGAGKCSCSRAFWWRDWSPCSSFGRPEAADTARHCDLGACVIPTAAGPISGGTGFLLTKIYYHVLLLGGRRKAVRNLQERGLGPGSRETSFSAKLSFTTAFSFFQEEVTAQLVMKSPPQPCYLTPLASQGHEVWELNCHQLLRPFGWTNCIITIHVHSDSYSEYFPRFSQCFVSRTSFSPRLTSSVKTHRLGLANVGNTPLPSCLRPSLFREIFLWNLLLAPKYQIQALTVRDCLPLKFFSWVPGNLNFFPCAAWSLLNWE